MTAAVPQIDDNCGEDRVPKCKIWDECARDSGGDDELRRIVSNCRLSCTAATAGAATEEGLASSARMKASVAVA